MFVFIYSIVVFLLSAFIVRKTRQIFMKIVGANFMLVNPVTSIVFTIVLTVVIINSTIGGF